MNALTIHTSAIKIKMLLLFFTYKKKWGRESMTLSHYLYFFLINIFYSTSSRKGIDREFICIFSNDFWSKNSGM